jgi:hypothetical protein
MFPAIKMDRSEAGQDTIRKGVQMARVISSREEKVREGWKEKKRSN